MTASLARQSASPHALDEHIVVALIPSVADQLRCLQEDTNFSATDIINRAITLYAFLDEQIRADNDLLVRDTRTRETKLVRFV